MPGNTMSPNQSQQVPYIKYMKGGKYYDVNGKILSSGNLPEAHIPVSMFDMRKMPKF